MINNKYAIISAIIILLLVAVTAGCLSTTTGPGATTGPGSTIGASKAPTTNPTTTALTGSLSDTLLSLYKSGKLHWYEYNWIDNKGKINPEKLEFNIVPYGGVQNAWYQKRTTTGIPVKQPIVTVLETYSDGNHILGGHGLKTIDGQIYQDVDAGESYGDDLANATVYDLRGYKIVGTETVTVPAGTFVCTKYEMTDYNKNILRTWISDSVPVPVKMTTTIGTTEIGITELSGWG